MGGGFCSVRYYHYLCIVTFVNEWDRVDSTVLYSGGLLPPLFYCDIYCDTLCDIL